MRNNLSSSLLTEAVDQFASLPGIGRKTALRLALHLLGQPSESVTRFSSAFVRMRQEIRFCPVCNMISDDGECPFCGSFRRDGSVICVVESIRDVLSIEATGQYNGVYHILGGKISPLDGVGPDDLPIAGLVERVASGGVAEVVLALSTDMEGETTSFYIFKKISSYPVKVSAIARGVGFGDDLEYTDQMTLGRAMAGRQAFRP